MAAAASSSSCTVFVVVAVVAVVSAAHCAFLSTNLAFLCRPRAEKNNVLHEGVTLDFLSMS